MKKDIHDQKFSDGTKLKLEVFRKYIREWVSVFMTESPSLSFVDSINIFDFFSGPGMDSIGNPGTPIIILNEVKEYCKVHFIQKSKRPINIFFNDKNVSKINALEREIPKYRCDRGCCNVKVSTEPFEVCFENYFPIISDRNVASLVILDPFGISVTPDIVGRLAECRQTDILFFIPSSHIHRFQKHPSFVSKINLGSQNADYLTIHRAICDHYREKIGHRKYFLAPFSIKEGNQIHGVIFGSGSLYGLEKFLNVCWNIDSAAGEANYPVDGDPAWGVPTMFQELNTIYKVDLFEQDLKAYIEAFSPDNLSMYEFVLTRGFTRKKASESLLKMQRAGWLNVESLITDEKIRKGTFYLGHQEKIAKLRFRKGSIE